LENLYKLNLSNNNLNGSIPKSFSNLKNLHELNLSNNTLSGYVPYGFNNLTNLNTINLSYNTGLKGYSPIFPEHVECFYEKTNLCTLKSDKCTGPIYHGCSLANIQETNKENGAPNISTYNDEVLIIGKIFDRIFIVPLGVIVILIIIAFFNCRRNKRGRL